jgi:hypothetical protein
MHSGSTSVEFALRNSREALRDAVQTGRYLDMPGVFGGEHFVAMDGWSDAFTCTTILRLHQGPDEKLNTVSVSMKDDTSAMQRPAEMFVEILTLSLIQMGGTTIDPNAMHWLLQFNVFGAR